MKEDITLDLEPSWNFTSEVWAGCSKCDFAFLLPLVAMIGKKPSNLKFTETKKSLLGAGGQILKPKKDSGYRVFGFMLPYSKFCRKCKAVYIAKLDSESIKLENKYWEQLTVGIASDFVGYLDAHTKTVNLYQQGKCECGEPLIVLSDKCPICGGRLKISEKEVDGLPIMKINSHNSRHFEFIPNMLHRDPEGKSF